MLRPNGRGPKGSGDGTRPTRCLTEAVKKEKSPLGFDHLWFFFFMPSAQHATSALYNF